ncbi:IclR family transcriptional regulator [Rahnella aquatilis]|uniref:Transcriptional regulator n=1 Tax=Rahnella aquatilis (strain ATCC 33071 / DSM 4594 / JCM 1683 / NBRC 105701 / NCIMB 13365 / CIP 78.65) TaxID=745277 RepID=H2IZP1_RAHAC|nr:IclR family transcriptional regulator [Rahnella aquatilis]AEX53284.1 transcriptional regulator [Rahnella aquatilis CIP 78.65 = ATCC 33071]KFD03932.1 IclR family transcriptional regulator [Rahnella aquatilis CIP 78.65 = ATCC 33071]
MTTLENAAAVLKLFSKQGVRQGHPGLSFSDVVEDLKLPKSTVSRLLMTMETEGLLERDPDSRLYRIGRLLLAVSSHYLSAPLVDLASPYMAQLSQLTQCTGYISMLEGRDIMVMRMFPGRTYLQVVTPAGSLLPAHETAIGRAILARYTDDEVLARYSDKYQVNSANSPASREILLSRLAEVRQHGVSFASNETLLGISTLATSIFNKHRNETVGLCLSFPSPAPGKEIPQGIKEGLIAVTRQIAEKLGDEYWHLSKTAM